MSDNPQHIIVFRLSAMGDVAMTVPVIRALVQQHPNVKVTIVSRAFFKPFFDIPNVSFFAFGAKSRHKGITGLFKLYRDLAQLKPTAFADLHNVMRSKVIGSMFQISGVKTATFDKDRKAKKMLTRAGNKVFKPLQPVFEKHAEVFKSLGFPIDLKSSTFPPKKLLSANVQQITGTKSRQWIGVAPFAQHQSKVYPADLMQKLIDQLSVTYRVFLFGSGNSEIEILNSFASGNENATVIAGKLDLSQELELINNLDVMISMDSANAHMAAMYGAPVITLWGATHPYGGFAPFNQPPENSITSDRIKYPLLPTSIYGNKIVTGYEDAMRTIAPESVVVRVRNILSQ